jgi:CheY-like chemotaxis protein
MRKRKKHEQAPAPKGPHRVLVVNDDEDACELLSRILVRAGYDVDRADSQEHALLRVSAEPPDCVVADLSTGAIGQNLALLDKIRSHPDERVAHSRVLLVTQQANNQMFSWQAGIDAFLVRPFLEADLLRELAEAIERPDDERSKHRRKRLDAATSDGR